MQALATRRPSFGTVVASIIEHDQAVYECMKQKLVNYHALAGKIKPEVERVAGRKTSINTLVVAIKRFADTLKEMNDQKPSLILKEAKITLSSDVVDVTISTTRSQLFPMIERISKLSSSLNEPIHIFQLSHSIKLIADEGEYKSFIRSALDKIPIARETTQLSRLDLHLSQAVEKTPEFGLFLTELLYRNGITIRQTYIGEETILILSREEGPRAYEILRREIDASRADFAGRRVRGKDSS
jgi:hypothetical protein